MQLAAVYGMTYYYMLYSLLRKSTKYSIKPVDSETVIVYNGLLTRLIESERRQRFGWFAGLCKLPVEVHLSECRQRSGWSAALV